MRLKEKLRLAKEAAKKILSESDFETLSTAIETGRDVLFHYEDRHGKKGLYKGNSPLSFFQTPATDEWPGAVYLWSSHKQHEKNEQYNVERITDVTFAPTLIVAMLDPPPNELFWDGSSQGDAIKFDDKESKDSAEALKDELKYLEAALSNLKTLVINYSNVGHEVYGEV